MTRLSWAMTRLAPALHPISTLGWLWAWMAIGAALRGWRLAADPPWTDEVATLVFSLGHSFRTVPLNQLLSLDTLMEPLRVDSMGNLGAVVQHLMTESTHPPLYFVLTHLWLRWLSAPAGWVDVGLARSLSAFWGVLAIPAISGLSRLFWRDGRVAPTAAALMALSPLGIYLAQDARHYTLAILWEIAGLVCGAIALRCLHHNTRLPNGLCLTWILVNALGLATHYFFGLFLTAQGMVLGAIYGLHLTSSIQAAGSGAKVQNPAVQNPAWLGIGISILGTVASGLVWIPALTQSRDNELTHWVFVAGRSGWDGWDPIVNTGISLMTMVLLLPIQNVPTGVMLGSGSLVIGASLGLWLWVWRGLQARWQKQSDRLVIGGLLGALAGAIALFLLLDYGFSTDLTRAFRYSFVYFPLVILAVAIGVTAHIPRFPGGPRALPLLLLLAGLGGLTVASHLGYQKVHRPDRVAQTIQQQALQQQAQGATIISIAHHTHGQTGRLMGVAWALAHAIPPSPTLGNLGNVTAPGIAAPGQAQFYLDHQRCDRPTTCDVPTPEFRQSLAQVARPFDVWLINFQGMADFGPQRCVFDQTLGTQRADGYRYQHYRCS
jgi:uncharacterized membrane protein